MIDCFFDRSPRLDFYTVVVYYTRLVFYSYDMLAFSQVARIIWVNPHRYNSFPSD